jgi:hypothetical protein
MAGPSVNYGMGPGWPVQALESVFLAPDVVDPECVPGGGTSYSDAAPWDSEAEFNLGPGDHWFVADYAGEVPQFALTADGGPFFAVHPGVSWEVWSGNGTDPPSDQTGGFTADGDTIAAAGAGFDDKVYLVLTVPLGCVGGTGLTYSELPPA